MARALAAGRRRERVADQERRVECRRRNDTGDHRDHRFDRDDDKTDANVDGADDDGGGGGGSIVDVDGDAQRSNGARDAQRGDFQRRCGAAGHCARGRITSALFLSSAGSKALYLTYSDVENDDYRLTLLPSSLRIKGGQSGQLYVSLTTKKSNLAQVLAFVPLVVRGGEKLQKAPLCTLWCIVETGL